MEENEKIEQLISIFGADTIGSIDLAFSIAEGQNIDLNKVFRLRYQPLIKYCSDFKCSTLTTSVRIILKTKEVVIRGKKITQLPKEIKYIGHIKELYLYGNKLSHLPHEITALENLEVLELDDNQFQNFPCEIKFLQNLRIFSIANNQISTLPKEIGSFRYLNTLYF